MLTVTQPAAAAPANELVNPGFEKGMKGWTNTGTAGAAYTQTSNPRRGTTNLAHYSTGTRSALSARSRPR